MIVVCSVEGCTKHVRTRGWCNAHYQRWYKHGDPESSGKGTGIRYPTPEEAFTNRPVWVGGCLIWPTVSGYGQLSVGNTPVLAHRYAWERVNGPIPVGLVIDHSCYNRSCVNIEHLSLATYQQNGENRSGPNRDNSSGYLNVSWSRPSRKWLVQVTNKGIRYHGGYFDDVSEANLAAIALRNKHLTHNMLDR